MKQRLAIPFFGLALSCWLACGPPPQPAAPKPAPSASAPAPAVRAAGYQRDRDGMSASFDHEENPFTRWIVAKMWEAVARVETPSDAGRAAAAHEALESSKKSVDAIADACPKEAYAAKEWAERTKQSLERRYLNSVDLLGEQNVGTRLVDAEVMVLRDEIETLERRLKPCPKQYFGPGER